MARRLDLTLRAVLGGTWPSAVTTHHARTHRTRRPGRNPAEASRRPGPDRTPAISAPVLPGTLSMAGNLTDPKTEDEIQALAAEAGLPDIDQAAKLARLLRLRQQPATPSRAAWPASVRTEGGRSSRQHYVAVKTVPVHCGRNRQR